MWTGSSGARRRSARSASWSQGCSPFSPCAISVHRSRRSGGSQRSTSAVVSSSGFLPSGYVVPSSGSALDLAAANWSTALGAYLLSDRRGDDPAALRGTACEQDRQPGLTCESGQLIPMRKSGRLDLNQRPFGPQPNALPDCATPRECRRVLRHGGKRAIGLEPTSFQLGRLDVQPVTPRPRNEAW